MFLWFKATLRSLASCLLLIAAMTPTLPRADEDGLVRIGVLAYRGKAQALVRWSRTAEYLSQRISSHRFEIVPVNLEEMSRAIVLGDIQFTLTNPGNYVDLETRYGVSDRSRVNTAAAGSRY
jgi:two-component system sensor histidine kinase TtrS